MDQIPVEQLLGQSTEHLIEFEDSAVLVHRCLADPLRQLIADAAQAGYTLNVASGFRSFERQCDIWNAKAGGQRPVLDQLGNPVSLRKLTDTEKLWAILRWSALPGTSRHHWGTDIDVWDSSAVPPDYQLQLVPEEYQQGGPFGPFNDWLTAALKENTTFFRPYAEDKGGVAPEPWHLSYRPVAQAYEQQLEVPTVAAAVEKSDILLKGAILDNIEEIFARFILC